MQHILKLLCRWKVCKCHLGEKTWVVHGDYLSLTLPFMKHCLLNTNYVSCSVLSTRINRLAEYGTCTYCTMAAQQRVGRVRSEEFPKNNCWIGLKELLRHGLAQIRYLEVSSKRVEKTMSSGGDKMKNVTKVRNFMVCEE